jgi:hypothetical protein
MQKATLKMIKTRAALAARHSRGPVGYPGPPAPCLLTVRKSQPVHRRAGQHDREHRAACHRAPESREHPGRYGVCPAIFRRAARSAIMSRWLVRMTPAAAGTASPSRLARWESAAAAGPAAAASAARGTASGAAREITRAAGREPAHRDRGQQLHRVVVTLRAGARGRGLGHRPVQLERVAAGAAAVLVAGHNASLAGRSTRRERPGCPAWPGRACPRRGREGPLRSGPWWRNRRRPAPCRRSRTACRAAARPARRSAT